MEQRATIMIVDDEPDIVETLDFALRRRGFAVKTAYDGDQALEAVENEPPDLMLLDVMLPGTNGYEVSRRLKERMATSEAFPILLLTARRVNSPEREDFVSTWSRADAVLYKPFALDRLVAAIEAHLPAEAAAPA